MRAGVEASPFAAVRRDPEPSRARYPDEEGFTERDGVRVFWERYGEGDPTIVFVAGWSLVHSRLWRAQIPYFARHHRVVTFDPRGNGRSDRPGDPEACSEPELARDIIDVMDAIGTERAILVSLSRGAQRSLIAAAEHPERVQGAVFLSPEVHLDLAKAGYWVKGELERYEGWDRLNPAYIQRDYHGFAEWWMGLCLPEPHSTRQIESSMQYALDTDPEALIAATLGRQVTEDELPGLAARVRCPVQVILGELDEAVPDAPAERLAELTGGELIRLAGTGHLPQARHPVRFNLMLRDFVRRVAATSSG